MSQETPATNLDGIMTTDIDLMMQQTLLKVPDNFDLRIMSRLTNVSQTKYSASDSKTNWLFKFTQICQWGVMAIGGSLAAAEVIAFVFGFWTATVAL
jgi:hypothetical protein